MVRSCEQSLNKLTDILHTLVVWSNVFYVFAAAIGFMSGHNIIAVIMLTIAVISTVYHTRLNVAGVSNKVWGHVDVVTAFVGSCIILVYGVYVVVSNRELSLLKSRRTITIGIVFIIMAVVSIAIFILARISLGGVDPEDPDKGIIGPLVGDSDVDNIKKKCYTRFRQAQFLVYHTIWHILGGIVAIFLSILITLE